MNVNDVAEIAVQLWDKETAVNMVAIAGAESWYNPEAGGDSPELLESLGFYGTAQLAREWNCPNGTEHGPASWGLWQIFLGANHDVVTQMSGLDDPCQMSEWLKDPVNNAKAADRILERQGYGAWAVYNSGRYLDFMDGAEEAVEDVYDEYSREPRRVFMFNPFIVAGFIAAGMYGVYISQNGD